MLKRVLINNNLKQRGHRMFSSCSYEKPFLFGPMFSAFFFGAVYTGFINNLCISIYNKQEEMHKELKGMKKELEQLNKK